MDDDPIFKSVPRSLFERLFWKPWVKTKRVRDYEAERLRGNDRWPPPKYSSHYQRGDQA